MKDEYEFRPTGAMPWRPGAQDLTHEKVLARDQEDPDILTRLARWEPGFHTGAGVIRHAWAEEVYLLEGDLHDLTLDRTFHAGWFASRPPRMPHGPYRTTGGCVMLEIRYRV
jgi:hypothetical protein